MVQAGGSPSWSLNVPRTSYLSHLRGLLVVSSSQDAALPVGGIAYRGPTRGLGGLAEVSEEPGNVLGLGDEGEQAHATATPWAGLDVDAEGSVEQLGPRPVAGRAGLSRARTKVSTPIAGAVRAAARAQ